MSQQLMPGRRGRKMISTAASLGLVAAIFGFGLPRVASYGRVWASIVLMTWPSALMVAVAAVASFTVGWLVICAVLPSIRLRQAAAVNLGSTAVANTLPAGGVLAMGVSWAMFAGWGVEHSGVRPLYADIRDLERLRPPGFAGHRPADHRDNGSAGDGLAHRLGRRLGLPRRHRRRILADTAQRVLRPPHGRFAPASAGSRLQASASSAALARSRIAPGLSRPGSRPGRRSGLADHRHNDREQPRVVAGSAG